MGIKAKPTGQRKGARGEPIFVTKSQLAHAMGNVEPSTIDDWVREGSVPPPHSRPGERTSLWLKRHFDYYVNRGHWPPEAWPSEEGASAIQS